MKIKKIIAPTMAQAVDRVKQELGQDAVIFQTKKVSHGKFFNLFKKEHVEILAASDPDSAKSTGKLRSIESENVDRSSEKRAEASQFPFQRVATKADRLFSGPAAVDQMYRRLSSQGMKEQHIQRLLKNIVKKWYQSDEKMTEDALWRELKDETIRMLRPDRFLRPSEKFIMLIGSTGVGKTTTVAKLAGRAVLEEKKKIAFVTADTFRIAAIDQLKTYADILQTPVQVAYNERDFREALKTYEGFDQIYIDTAGRNYRQGDDVGELRALVGDHETVGVCLVVAATAKYEDIAATMNRFGDWPVDHLIITKMDETATYGAIASTLIDRPDLHVAYITNGQNVPDDLRPADVRELADDLTGDPDEY